MKKLFILLVLSSQLACTHFDQIYESPCVIRLIKESREVAQDIYTQSFKGQIVQKQLERLQQNEGITEIYKLILKAQNFEYYTRMIERYQRKYGYTPLAFKVRLRHKLYKMIILSRRICHRRQ